MGYETIVRSCLYNWLGYGNLNAQTWFIGTEEGGEEFSKTGRLTIRQSLAKRAKFDLAMDFKAVWKDSYEYLDQHEFENLLKNHGNVWRYITAFYLYQSKGISYFRERDIKKEVECFFGEKFGDLKGEFFFCEFLPLPFPSSRKGKLLEPYQEIWKSKLDYENEVMPARFAQIMQEITERNNIKYIVCFDKRFIQFLLALKHNTKPMYWQANNNTKGKYCLFSLKLKPNRSIRVIGTPFFAFRKGCVGNYKPEKNSVRGFSYAASRVKQ